MEKITNDILYVGVNDHDVDLFEGQYVVENGMAYNSYVILDDKIAVMDSVDAHFTEVWLDQVKEATGGKSPDYLIVQHMEPDHSGSIAKFAEAYPDAKIVASAKAFPIMQQFFGKDYAAQGIVVGEGDTLSLGRHELTFVGAPMVHWPEVIVTYDSCDKVLFSADAFGKFGALDVEDEEGWACEARRYYIGIVGKYGTQVQALLKKAANLDIQIICPLHGPVLTENLDYYLNLYQTWSSYEPESKGVTIACASIYGHTLEAAKELADLLRDKGVEVELFDLDRDDMAEAVESAFQYDRIVLAASSYNAGVFPFMEEYIHHLAARNFQKRTVGIIENGSWAPSAARTMKKLLEGCKDLTFTDTTVTIKSALNADSEAQLKALAEELAG